MWLSLVLRKVNTGMRCADCLCANDVVLRLVFVHQIMHN